MPLTRTTESSRHVESVSAAMKILFCFHGDEHLSLTEIHRRTRITKSRILRLAGTLEWHGVLATDPGRKGYRLGPSLLRFGQCLETRYHDTVDILDPVLRRIADESGDTALFSVVQAGQRLCVASVEPDNPLRFSVPAGLVRPLHTGASGKVLMAFGSPKTVDEALSPPRLQALTECTVTDPERLRQQIAEIRRSGFAISRGEAQPDSFAIAVPVMDARGHMLGALSIAGPVSRLSQKRTETLLEILRDMAPVVGRALSFLRPSRGGEED